MGWGEDRRANRLPFRVPPPERLRLDLPRAVMSRMAEQGVIVTPHVVDALLAAVPPGWMKKSDGSWTLIVTKET